MRRSKGWIRLGRVLTVFYYIADFFGGCFTIVIVCSIVGSIIFWSATRVVLALIR